MRMVLLDGKKLSEKMLRELKDEIRGFPRRLCLAVMVVGSNPVVQKFIEQKKKSAESIGILVRVYPFPETITTNELRKALSRIVHEKKNSGVIVQLPLPEHINTQYILNAVTPEKDVDVLSARALGNFVVGKNVIFPPVAGAVKAFFDAYGISYRNKYVVVAGAGSLVGRPVLLWLFNERVTLGVIRSVTERPEEFLRKADIIISGVGKPAFITGDMVREGTVVIDAGTSESAGKVVGDVDVPSVSQKASFITPVPGGVGPVTVAVLLKNLVTLAIGGDRKLFD